MANVIIEPTETLSGEATAPPSKAYTQRTLIAALLSNGNSRILNPLVSEDTIATRRAVEAFGAEVQEHGDYWLVKGVGSLKAPMSPINCGESGATLRFMIPVAALAQNATSFILGSSLSRRPIKPLLNCLKSLGVRSTLQHGKDFSLIKVYGGGIRGGKTKIRGDISSQFISGLLFACPMASMDSEISLTTPLESKPYVQMTKEVLEEHGIQIYISEDFKIFKIPSKQNYKPYNHRISGDFSSAAYLLAAAAIKPSKVRIKNLNYKTKQGDKAIIDILRRMGLKLKVGDYEVEAEGTGKPLNALEVDVSDIPDLLPICAVLACYSEGTSKIYNARRLRYKESNRLLSIYSELKKMGAEIVMEKDGLTIKGPCKLHGATINAHNDHRIAMACAIAALGASGKTEIQNAECVKKSYPKFFDDLRLFGVNVVGKQFDR
ncbi:MAG: 3-phosphoshikimate 1-carboxyvinyltransferase [Candidatus Bathyarchaeia archaeon]